MKINSIKTSPSFGKTRVLSAKVKNLKTDEFEQATLYKMDSKNPYDYDEMENAASNSRFYHIYKDFSNSARRSRSYQDYYLLTTDNDNKPIAAAESASFCFDTNDERKNNINVVVEELASDKEYKDAHLPVLAKIVSDAEIANAKNVFTAFREEDYPDLKTGSFSVTKHENWLLPKKRFDTLLTIAAKKTYVEFDEQSLD